MWKLVKRLRDDAETARNNWADVFSVDPCLVERAADLIEQQAARIAALEEGLREIEYLDRPQVRGLPRRKSINEIARALLGGSND